MTQPAATLFDKTGETIGQIPEKRGRVAAPSVSVAAGKLKAKAKTKAKPAGTAVAIHQPKPQRVAKRNDPISIMAIIDNAARDPQVDPAKMRELLAIRKELKAEEAKEAFIQDLIRVQKELPTISKKGRINIEKNGHVIQSTPYAKFEDINRICKPILQAHNFTMTFRTDAASDARTVVTAILMHKGGHQEQSSLTLPVEASGSKNNVQGVGSAVAYGKRYTMTALLNLIAEGDDDDGNLGGAAEISNEQLTELIEAADAAGVDKRKFCDHFKIEGMAKLPAKRFYEAIGMISQAAAHRGKTKAKA